jgi:hypothetical protein
MLERASKMMGYALRGADGDLGQVKDFYFDDQRWTARYLVIDTEHWLPGRKVLISPHALTAVNREGMFIVADLSRTQVGGSPPVESDIPVARQFEERYNDYFGWTRYWSDPPTRDPPSDKTLKGRRTRGVNRGGKLWDPHLRSCAMGMGYSINASDGEMGTLEDFVIDTVTWVIRYLIVDAGFWLPGKRVLVSPLWIEKVNWQEARVSLRIPRENMEEAPAYTEESLLTREYEIGLQRHYDQQGLWAD